MTERKELNLNDVCENMIKGGKSIGDDIPRSWIRLIEEKFIDPLNSRDAWELITGAPDFRSVKYRARYFPTQQFGAEAEAKAEWKKLTDAARADSYPDTSDSSIRHVNHGKISELTNHGTITPDVKLSAGFAVDEYHKVLQALRETGQTDILAKLVYYVIVGPSTYTLAWRDTETISAVCGLLDDEKFGDIISHGLWRSNYLLAHEEECLRDSNARGITDSSNCVFSYEEYQKIGWIQRVYSRPLDENPLVTICPGGGASVYQSTVFHLKGRRAIASLDTIRQRIDRLTGGSLRGFERWDNIALVGSTITECVGDNSLLDYEGGFDTRTALYFGGSSDIDIAVRSDTYAGFCDQVADMVKLISENIGDTVKFESITTGSGVRYRVSHPKLARHYEIFRTPLPLVTLVSGFHVWAVKALWNFRTLIMTRSFMQAMLTGLCDSFDWFSCNKIPVDVVLKNAQRGYTIACSQRELKTVIDYFRETKGSWQYRDYKQVADVTGSFDKNSKFFRVDLYPLGLRAGCGVVDGKNKDTDVSQTGDHTYKTAVSLKYKGRKITKWIEGSGGNYYVAMPPEW